MNTAIKYSMPVFPEANTAICWMGYHGTLANIAREIVSKQQIIPSENKSDWLGKGAYFWQDNPHRALSWARERNPGTAIVLDSVLECEHTESAALGAMFASDIDLLRAVAVQRVIHGQDVSPEVGLISFKALSSSVERTHAIAEWIGDLRVQANRKGEDVTELQDLRRPLTEGLTKVWPQSLSADEARAVVARAEGPGVGGWALSTMEEILEPLIEAGKLSVKAVFAIWNDLLLERIQKKLSREKTGSHGFYGPNDLPLSEVWASALWTCLPEDRSAALAGLLESSRAALRELRAPFPRSRDYNSWHDAYEGLHWLRILIGLVLWHAPKDAQTDELDKWISEATRLTNVLGNYESDFTTDIERISTDLWEKVERRKKTED